MGDAASKIFVAEFYACLVERMTQHGDGSVDCVLDSLRWCLSVACSVYQIAVVE
jgi:hypothetical protein